MMIHERDIENRLKESLRDIHPEREAFNQLFGEAERLSRSKLSWEGMSVLSPYQLTFSSFMKKVAYIGVPVIVLVLVAVFALQNTSTKRFARNGDPVQQKTNVEVNSQVPKAEEILPVAETRESLKDDSIDEIMDGFIAEAEADAMVAINDSFDSEYIYSELGAVPQVNSNDYENII